MTIPADLSTANNQLLTNRPSFYTMAQERRKFGPLGWNIKYDFSSGDLDCVLQTLRMFLFPIALAESEEAAVSATAAEASIPWVALKYVTGEVRKGLSVTDEQCG